MNANQVRIVAAGAVLLGLLLTVGCYESKYTLGTAAEARVDPAYVGDYTAKGGDPTAKGGDDKTVSIVIRNIDGKQYYVEWKGTDDKEPTRAVGFIADVKGATFANVRVMTDTGTLDEKYFLMRASLSADKTTLTIRNLNDDFFKDKTIDSAAALKTLIGDNLDNGAMYDALAIVASRVVPAKNN